MSAELLAEGPCWNTAVVSEYEQALRSASALAVHDETGVALPFDTARWLDPPDAADETLLSRCTGPTLDLGCGPGRLVRALTARGVPALGVDVSGHAVALTRASGALALRRSLFDRLPGAGRWSVALLADGNIGIGGNAARLLTRLRELLAPDGLALIEVDAVPGEGHFTARLTGPRGETVATFPWARISAAPLIATAEPLGFRAVETWAAADREFVALRRC